MSGVREWVGEIWRYRELVYFLVWRDLKVRYKQTLMGIGWAIIQPLFTMIVFTLLFGRLVDVPSDGIPYPIFSYSALVAWTYFATAMSYSGNSLVTNANLISKVYFPRAALPGAATLSGLPDFALSSLVLIVLMAYYRIPVTWELALWPLLVVPLVMLALGGSFFLAALNARFRDVKYAIPFVVQLWLFLTPVIYPTSLVPERFQVFIALNPMTGLIEAFRAALIPTRGLDWNLLSISLGMTVLCFVGGLMFFRHAERHLADVI